MPPLPKVDPAAETPFRPGRARLNIGAGRCTEVDACLLGCLAVHADLLQPRCWAVTHTPTGLLVTLVATRADAERIAQHLWTTVRGGLSATSKAGVLRALPPWVRPWADACKQARAWVEPPPPTDGRKG